MNETKKSGKKRRQPCGECGPCKVEENCGTCGSCKNPNWKQACIRRKCKRLQSRHAEPDPKQPLLTSYVIRRTNSTQSSTSSTDTSRPTSQASTSQESRQPTPELQSSADIVRNLIPDVEHVSETRSSASEEQSSSTLEGQVVTRGQLEQKAKSDQHQMPASGKNENKSDQQLQKPILTGQSQQSKKVQNSPLIKTSQIMELNTPKCQSNHMQRELLDHSTTEEPRHSDIQNGLFQ